MRACPFLLVLGCNRTQTPDPLPSEVSLSCAIDPANVLRASCVVTADPPADVTVTWVPSGTTVPVGGPTADPDPQDDPNRIATVPQGQSTVTLLWLEPRTEHLVTATHPNGATATTTVVTDEAPTEAQIMYSPEGTSTVRRLLFETRCQDSGLVVVASTQGATQWYQEFGGADPNAEVLAAMMTERGTVLTVGEGKAPPSWVREMDLYGNLLFEATEFPHPLHHDVFERNHTYYVLFHEQYLHTDGRMFLMDGFYILDDAGAIVGTWRLLDHFDPDQLTAVNGISPIDFSHANSIYADEAGNVLVSFRYLSAIANIRGDWTAPDFGEVEWWLTGNPGAPNPSSDLDIVSSAGLDVGFIRQHHAVRVGHRLTVYDNQPLGVLTRLLAMTINEPAGEVDIDEVYTLDRHCDFQGSHFTLPNGNALGSCAPVGRVYEFDKGASKHRYAMSTSCLAGPEDGVFRMMPIDHLLPANGG